MRTGKGRDDGFALLYVMAASVLLTLIGLALTLSSLSDFLMSNEFEAHEKAIGAAVNGLELARDELRGKDLNSVLSETVEAPKYLAYSEPEAGSFAARNPIPLREARSVDFDNPPAPVGSRNAAGLLTPLGGSVIEGARYFASISDNADETPMGLPEDPRVDVDSNVFLRAIGISPSALPGTAEARNAVAVVEAALHRDLSFDLESPFLIYGPDVDATFNGNSFDLIGDEEHAAVAVAFDAPEAGDGQTIYDSMLAALGDSGNVEGMSGPDGVSLIDATQIIRESSNADASNLFNGDFLANLSGRLRPYADNFYENAVHLSGGGVDLGTSENPKLTVALGDFTLTGAASGAGLLVVKGKLELGGAFVFDGLVLALGEGDVWLHGANKDLGGGLLVARIEEDGNGGWTFGVPTVRISGNSNIVLDRSKIRLALSLLPMRILSWREVGEELDAS